MPWPQRADPPPSFFAYLERLTVEAHLVFRGLGFVPESFDCIFRRTDFPDGWWDLQMVKYVGSHPTSGERKTVYKEVQPALFERPIRRVKWPKRAQVIVDANIRVPKSLFSTQDRDALLAKFSYRNPEVAKRKRLGFYAGDLPEFIETASQDDDELILPRGGMERLKTFALARKIGFDIVDRRVFPGEADISPRKGAKRLELREDQLEMVEAAVRQETCLIRAATGSGKTEAAIALMERLRTPTIVVVWSAGLMKQWVSRISARLGWKLADIGVLGGGQRRIAPITVAMQQTLYKRPDDYGDVFGLFIGDEVQRWAARTFRDVVRAFPAKYRVAFSADETRKDRMEGLIYDHFGKVAVDINKERLIARGELCEVEIVVVPTNLRVRELDDAPREERGEILGQMHGEILDTIAADQPRNAIVAAIAADEVKAKRSTLIFVDRTAHAHALATRIATQYRTPCGVAIGGVENRDTFDETIARLSSGKLLAAAATSCVYQGTDVPRLAVGIVASPTASNKQLVEQQVGRLRRKFPGKVRGRLYYIWDQHVFPTHLQNLIRYYGRDLVRVEEWG